MAGAVDIAARLFTERGYGSTTTRDLARAMGVTNGTLYHYFPTKEDLLFRICEESIQRLTAAVSEAVAGQEPSRERVAAMIVAHVRTLLANEPLHTTLLTELRSLNGENRQAIERFQEQYRTLVQDVLEEAQEHGVIRTDLDPRFLRISLLNLANWTMRYRPDHDPPKEELALTLATLFLDGARPADAGSSG